MSEKINSVSVRQRAAHFGAFALYGPVARYIRKQRDRLANDGVSLGQSLTDRFRPYFGIELLESVRIVASDDLHIPPVPFEAVLRRLGVFFPSTQLFSGITFDNIVAVREQASPGGLLFHELVHVAQYRLLGTGTFARLYVRGFLAEGSYDRIPLERCASILEERFASGRAPFSVEAAVSSWFERGLF